MTGEWVAPAGPPDGGPLTYAAASHLGLLVMTVTFTASAWRSGRRRMPGEAWEALDFAAGYALLARLSLESTAAGERTAAAITGEGSRAMLRRTAGDLGRQLGAPWVAGILAPWAGAVDLPAAINPSTVLAGLHAAHEVAQVLPAAVGQTLPERQPAGR